MPGTSAAVATDIQTIYGGFVKPLIDQAGNSLIELQLASRRLGRLRGAHAAGLAIENVQMVRGLPRRRWRIC